jgi:hypothetical protein
LYANKKTPIDFTREFRDFTTRIYPQLSSIIGNSLSKISGKYVFDATFAIRQKRSLLKAFQNWQWH